MSTTILRQAAAAAYLAAVASPASTDWRQVAADLFSVLPASAKAPAASDVPFWWADWSLPRHYQLDSLEVIFADGETVRCNLAKAKGKLPRVAAACRVAIGFYRERTGNAAVPALAMVRDLTAGAHFDAVECSRLTAEVRAVPGTVQGKLMTLERIARMERELERRRAGLASHLANPCHYAATDNCSAEEWSERWDASWRAAVAGAEDELASMRAAYRAQTMCEADTARPVTAEPFDVEACAEALAPFYGEPAEAEHAGTFDAEAGTMSAFAPSIVVEKTDTPPAEAIASAPPAEEIASEPVEAAEPAAAADLSTEADDWRPTAESHPIVALALSEKARSKIFETVLDGTFHDSGARVAKCGAWRLSLADAEALQGVGSIRFVGMPRKVYTRRAAPAEAIAAPVVIPSDVVPFIGSAGYPMPSRPDCAVVCHSPSL